MMRWGGVLALSAIALGATAQAPALVGTVHDEMGAPVEGAVAYLFHAGRVTITDARGLFEFAAPPTEDVLTVSAPGHTRASFAVRPTDPPRTFVLARLDEATRTVPFDDTVRFDLASRQLGVPIGDGVRSVSFHVDPGANGGRFEVEWTPGGPIPARLRAHVVHAPTGATFGFLDGEPPLRYPLGSALLRDLPGPYRLDVELRDGNAVGVTALVRGFVAYGPWVAKTVEGKEPEVSDALNDRGVNAGRNPDMDIASVRFTNETDEQVDVEMELGQLAEAKPRPGFHGYWTVQWTYAGKQWGVFMRGDEGSGPAWYAGQCEGRPTECTLANTLPGSVVPGTPGLVRWHVPKVTIGDPADGTALESPFAENFEIPFENTFTAPSPLPMDKLPIPFLTDYAVVIDDTPPADGQPYAFGAAQYAVAGDVEARLRTSAAADRGSGPGLGLPMLGLLGTTVLLTGGAWAWGRQRQADRLGGRYRHLRVLGEGSSGRTSLARDRVSGQLVAVKECAAARADPTLRAHVLREARIGSRIAHANVVRVLDIQETPRADLIVMEYVQGGNLEARLASGALRNEEALRLWSDILAGLDAIHQAGIVHRDVKPSNVLLTEAGRAKVADFGVARSVTEETLGPAGPVGTPLYMAPEQLRGREPTAASDVYASAAVAYRMLAGRAHVQVSGRTAWDVMLARRGKRPDLPVAGLPPWLNDLLARCLAEGPARRPSAAEALRELQRHAPRA